MNAVGQDSGAATRRRPASWWFGIHGALLIAFSVFALAIPPDAARGFLADGRGFAAIGVAVLVLAMVGAATAALWVLVAALVLLGGCMLLAAAGMALVWFTVQPDPYEVAGLVLAIASLLYGTAVLIAALQLRTAYRWDDAVRG